MEGLPLRFDAASAEFILRSFQDEQLFGVRSQRAVTITGFSR
jgi:hypothetical protein